MANSLPQKSGHGWTAGTFSGAAKVYKQTPVTTGTAATTPVVGALALSDVWAQVYPPGATDPTHVLVAKGFTVIAALPEVDNS